MKHLFLLATLAFFTFCSEQQEITNDNTDEVYLDTTNDVRTAQRDLDTSVSSAEREKNEMKAELQSEVDRTRLDIEELKSEVKSVRKEARKEYEENIAELEKENRELRERLDAFEYQSEENWQQFKSDFRNDLAELDNDVKNLFKNEKKKDRD